MVNPNSHNVKGILDPLSDLGRGTIIEYVVLEVLGDCAKEKMNFKYDLTSTKYGTINVKSSKKHYSNSKKVHYWEFNKLSNAYIPNYYICIGMSEYHHVIRHAWIIPGTDELVRDKGIIINSVGQGYDKFKKYELDAEPFDRAFQNFDNTKYPEFCNIKKGEFKRLQLQYIPVDKEKLLREEQLRWIDENEFKKNFDPENGDVSVFPTIHVIPYTENLFPVYSHNGTYLGFVENGSYTVITGQNKNQISMIMRLRSMIKSLTKYEGKANFRYIFEKFGDMNINRYLKILTNEGYIRQINDYDYEYIKEDLI